MPDQPIDEPDLPPGEVAEAHVDPEAGAGGAETGAGDGDGDAGLPGAPDPGTPDEEVDEVDEEVDGQDAGGEDADEAQPKDAEDGGSLLDDLDPQDPDDEHPADVDDPDAAVAGPDGETTQGEPGTTHPTVLRRLVAPVVAAPVLAGVLALVLALVLVVAAFFVLGDRSTADRLEIGQCVSLREDNRIEPVDCGDARARFRVVFIEKDTTESVASSVCARYPEATMSYFEGDQDTPDGDLICLGTPR